MTYHNYIFFDTDARVYDFDAKAMKKHKEGFVALVEKNKKVVTYGYSTLGFKAGTRFMLWFQSEKVEEIQNLLNSLLHTELGRYLKISYTLFGMVRASQYSRHKATVQEQAIDETVREKYLVVYPFTKTIEWHLIPFEERRTLMIDHMKIGHKFAPIKQLLLYAYGVDDHEFVVSYETQALLDFQSLVMELRGTEARRHTKNDTPIFTCIHQPLREALDFI